MSVKIAKSPKATGKNKKVQSVVSLVGAAGCERKFFEKRKKLLTKRKQCDNLTKLSRDSGKQKAADRCKSHGSHGELKKVFKKD